MGWGGGISGAVLIPDGFADHSQPSISTVESQARSPVSQIEKCRVTVSPASTGACVFNQLVAPPQIWPPHSPSMPVPFSIGWLPVGLPGMLKKPTLTVTARLRLSNEMLRLLGPTALATLVGWLL